MANFQESMCIKIKKNYLFNDTIILFLGRSVIQSFVLGLKGELQPENMLICYERAFKMLKNDMYIAGISQVLWISDVPKNRKRDLCFCEGSNCFTPPVRLRSQYLDSEIFCDWSNFDKWSPFLQQNVLALLQLDVRSCNVRFCDNTTVRTLKEDQTLI